MTGRAHRLAAALAIALLGGGAAAQARVAQPPPTSAAPETADADFNSCTKPGARRRAVPVSLKPDADVGQLIAWISSITCKAFVWSDAAVGATRRHVTVVAPKDITPARAFRLFLDALSSVDLTVQPFDGFYQVIESVRAHTRPIPLYDWDGHRVAYRRQP